MSTLLNQLLSIARLGFRIFPCWSLNPEMKLCTCGSTTCRNIAKHPATLNGCHDATTDEARIRRWVSESNGRYNWAIATGNDFGVLDIDPRHGGNESWLRLLLDCTDISLETPLVRTGSKGRHYYYRLPAGVSIGNRTGFRPGLDWKVNGGYVLIPPSLHPCGQRYEWETPITTPMALAPECLLETLRKPKAIQCDVSLVHSPKSEKLFHHVIPAEPAFVVEKGIVTTVTMGGVGDPDDFVVCSHRLSTPAGTLAILMSERTNCGKNFPRYS